MKTIVKLLLSAALVLILPAVALAQIDQIKNSTPEQRAEMQAKMKKKLKAKQAAAQTPQ